MSTSEVNDDGLVLVTGATGFLAIHIVQLLQREGYKVRGTVRSLKNEGKLKPLRDLCPDAKYPLELVEADLTKDDGWEEVLTGCRYCLHVASPFPNAPPKTPEDIIVPAVEGTERVLRACANTGTVKRIVLTSSAFAAHGEHKSQEGRIYTEEDWTDVDSDDVDPYPKSKTMAERAAWDFISSLPAERNLELVVINPGAILGPNISGVFGTSVELILRLMNIRKMPMIPRIYLPICDVRDVALAHVRAMTLPEAAGNRYIIVSDHMWYPDVGKLLEEEFGGYGYCIPTHTASEFPLRIYSFFDRSVKLVLPHLGQATTFSNRRMREVLKIEPRDVKETLLDTVHGLIECGAVKETGRYKSEKKNRNEASTDVEK